MKPILLTILACLPFLASAAEPIPVPSDVPYIDTIKKWNDAALGLPALPLVVVGCIVIGYFVKMMKWIPNKIIPTIVFVFGIVANVGIQPPTTMSVGIRAVILGMLAGAASIIIHRKWLKSWIDEDVFPTEVTTVTTTTTTTDTESGKP